MNKVPLILAIFVLGGFSGWAQDGSNTVHSALEHATDSLSVSSATRCQFATGDALFSLSLDDCRSMAISNNINSIESELNIRAAQYQKAEAFTEYFPRLSAMGLGYVSNKSLLSLDIKDFAGHGDFGNNLQYYINNYASQYGIKPNFSLPANGYVASLTLMQPIYAGGRIVTGNRLAAMGLEAAKLQSKVQQRKTIEEIDDFYLQTISLQQKMQSLNEALTLVDSLYKDASSAFEAGVLAQEDFNNVSHKRKELLATRNKLRSGIKLSKMNLLNSIGMQYEFFKLDSILLSDSAFLKVQPPQTYYVSEDSIVTSLQEARLLQLNVESKVLLKQMELGATLPQVGVGAMYSYNAITKQPDSYAIAFASVQIPISDWWKTSIKMKRLQTEIDKAAAQRDYFQSQLLLLVRKTWVDLCSAWDDYTLAIESSTLSRESLQRVRAKNEAGLATISDVLAAQSALSLAINDESDALSAYRKALQKWLDFLP